MAWSPVTGQVAVGLLDEVYVWAEGTGATLLQIPASYGEVTSVLFAPAYSVADYQDSIVPNSVHNKGGIHNGQSQPRYKTRPLPPDNLLAIGYKDGTLVLYNVDTDRIMGYYVQSTGAISFISWAPAHEKAKHVETSSRSFEASPSSSPGTEGNGNSRMGWSVTQIDARGNGSNSNSPMLEHQLTSAEQNIINPNSSISNSTYNNAVSGTTAVTPMTDTSASIVTDATSLPSANRNRAISEGYHDMAQGAEVEIRSIELGPKHKQYMLIGDDRGTVRRLHLSWSEGTWNNAPGPTALRSVIVDIEEGEVLKGHSQQICGNHYKHKRLLS